MTLTTSQTVDHQPQVEWHTDSEGFQFPRVPLTGGTWHSWEAFHSVDPHTEWVDGSLIGDECTESVDVVAIGADDRSFAGDEFDLADLRAAAQTCWAAGGVHQDVNCGVTALFVPSTNLMGNVIALAVARFVEGRR